MLIRFRFLNSHPKPNLSNIPCKVLVPLSPLVCNIAHDYHFLLLLYQDSQCFWTYLRGFSPSFFSLAGQALHLRAAITKGLFHNQHHGLTSHTSLPKKQQQFEHILKIPLPYRGGHHKTDSPAPPPLRNIDSRKRVQARRKKKKNRDEQRIEKASD